MIKWGYGECNLDEWNAMSRLLNGMSMPGWSFDEWDLSEVVLNGCMVTNESIPISSTGMFNLNNTQKFTNSKLSTCVFQST